MTDTGTSDQEIKVINIPEQFVLSLRTKIQSYRAQREVWPQLWDFVAQNKLKAIGSPITLYHDRKHMESNIDVELCIPIDQASANDISSDLLGDMKIYTLPAYDTGAFVTHYGSFNNINKTYGDLFQWIEENNYNLIDAPREISISMDPNDSTEASYVTNIIMPFKE